MLSSPRRLALSWRAVCRCSVRCLMRSVRSAIWTSGEPVSLSSRRYVVITSFLLGSVADGTRCPFLILWISYSLMSLPDGHRSAERSKPRKERGGLFGALPRVARGHVPAADHHENFGKSGRDGRLGLLQRFFRGSEAHRDRPAHRRRIASRLGADGVQRFTQRDALFERGGIGVPHVRVPGRQAQHPLPLRADPDRWMRTLHRLGFADRVFQLVEATLVGRSRLGPEELHRAQRFVEHRDAVARARKRQTELGELRLVPACADPELEAPVREVIDGNGNFRHETRVSVQVARDVQPHSGARRDRGHRPQHGPPIEDQGGGIRSKCDEVIERPDVIEARRVGGAPDVDLHVDGMYLLRKLQAVAKRIVLRGHLCRIYQASAAAAFPGLVPYWRDRSGRARVSCGSDLARSDRRASRMAHRPSPAAPTRWPSSASHAVVSGWRGAAALRGAARRLQRRPSLKPIAWSRAGRNPSRRLRPATLSRKNSGPKPAARPENPRARKRDGCPSRRSGRNSHPQESRLEIAAGRSLPAEPPSPGSARADPCDTRGAGRCAPWLQSSSR